MPTFNLYHSEWCFFCQRVRQALKKMPNVQVSLRDVADPQHRQALIDGGGKSQVPCLLIEENGNQQWLYESDDIIRYLSKLN